jgi:hypothetical protein
VPVNPWLVPLLFAGCEPSAELPPPPTGPVWSTVDEPTSPGPLTLPEPAVVTFEGSFAGVLPDLDGDGADDLLTVVSEQLAGGPYVYDPVVRWAFALWPGPLVRPPSAVQVLAVAEPRFFSDDVYASDNLYGTDIGLWGASVAGDLTGDGELDLWVRGVPWETSLVPGPFPTTDLHLLAREAGVEPFSGLLAPIDADGDGNDDLVGTGRHSGSKVYTGYYVYSWALYVCPGPNPDLTLATCAQRELEGWYSALPSGSADLDGDGGLEILVTEAYGTWQMAAYSATDLQGAPFLTVAGGGDAGRLIDLNGDGALDLLWQPHSVSGSPVYAVYGPFTRGTTVSVADADVVIDLSTPIDPLDAQPSTRFGGAIVPAGRSAASIVLSSSAPIEYWLFDVSSPGTYTLDDAPQLPGAGVSTTFGVGDLDADGQEDLVYGDGSAPGQASVYFGASLP